MKKTSLQIWLAAAGMSLAAPLAWAAAAQEEARGADRDASATLTVDAQPVTDAFVHGKIVSAIAINPHVSAYQLDVDVDHGVARLRGAVETEVERDLAVEIARGIDGVTDVRSEITVKAGARESARIEREKARRTVGQTLDDAGTTAAIKTKLLANRNTSGLKINVTTRNNVVTLTGTVASEADKDLAAHIARNSSDVVEVRNELTISARR